MTPESLEKLVDQFRMALLESEPLIWRQIQVCAC